MTLRPSKRGNRDDVPKLSPTRGRERKNGLRLIDVNPYSASVPKTGLEPALPLREPAPEAEIQELATRYSDIGATLESQWFMGNATISHCIEIIATLSSRWQFCPL